MLILFKNMTGGGSLSQSHFDPSGINPSSR